LIEASLSLGATRWQVIREVVLPTAKIGLFGATFLALARATGETVAVALIAGGVANVQFHLLYPERQSRRGSRPSLARPRATKLPP